MSVNGQQRGWSGDRWTGYGLILYVILIGMISLPFPLHPFEWADIGFLLLLFLVLYRLPWLEILREWTRQNKRVVVWLMVYLSVNWMSALVNGTEKAIVESVGRTYLVVVLLVFLVGFSSVLRGSSQELWKKVALVMGGVLSMTAFSGFALWCFGVDTSQVLIYPDYPYLESVPRLRSLTPSPAYLLSYAAIPFLYLAAGYISGKRTALRALVLLSLVAVILLTLSKSIVLIVMGVWLSLGLWKKWSFKWVWGFSFLLIVIHMAGTHLIVKEQGTSHSADVPFLSGNEVARFGKWKVMGTSYLALKKASIPQNAKLWLVGTGPGGFNEYLSGLKTRGRYPAHLPDYDPHSTFMGALIETGLPGFLLVVLAWMYLLYRSGKIWRRNRDTMSLFFFVIFVVYAVDAFSMDMMNFRHLWMLVGAFLGWSIHQQVS